MKTAATIAHCKNAYYQIEYYTGCPYLWQYNEFGTSDIKFSSDNMLIINDIYIGYDGLNIIVFDGYDLTKNEFTKINYNNLSEDTYKLNFNGLIEKVCPVTIQPINSIYTYKGQWMDGSRPDGCRHNWKSYQGFTETYNYCEKCDLKQKQGE